MPPVITVIAGPTASGKSGHALNIARQNNGTIINADSLQIYDALPILTAQPEAADLAAAPHFLYGILPPTAQSTAAAWAALAVQAIEETMDKGRMPIVVGGTGLYLKALLRGLSPIPSVPEAVRQEARARHKEIGAMAFYADLSAHDPLMAGRLHPNDTQRVIRAWEVVVATGQSLADWQDAPPQPLRPHWRYDVTLILPPRDVLYARCDARFLQMVTAGVLDEVAAYDGPADAACTKALGYAPLAAHLRGEITLENAVAKAQQDTRNYAKRQVTWFKGQLKPTDTINVR